MPWFDDAEKADRDYSEAIEADPSDTRAYLYRGAALQCLSRPVEALADYRRVVELTPVDRSDSQSVAILVEAHICLGISVGRRNEPLAAIDEFTQAIVLNPNRYLAYYNRGIAWSKCDEPAKAITDFSKTIEINPNYADAYLLRGLELRRLGMQQSSRVDFAKVREFNKNARDSNSSYRCGNRVSSMRN